ncbi:MAG: hypothetical protein Kow0062_06760 [Acidobacteriota bacterium]
MRAWRRGSRRELAVLLAILLPAIAGGAEPAGGTASPESATRVRRFGVVGLYNPRLMFLKYQPLVDYLSEATGTSWELVVDSAYQGTVERLCRGELDMALLGPLTYVRAHRACGARPLVKLRTGGRETYRSWIMVRQDSPLAGLRDLRGRRVAFGAALSTSSHLVPEAMLRAAGLEAGTDFSCRFYGHHERAARAVMLRQADACAVRDIVGEKFEGRGLRRIAVSDPIPNFPLVVPRDLPAGVAARVMKALLELDDNGRGVAWDAELAGGFVPATDEEYGPVRALARQLYGPRALELDERAWRSRCGGR